MSAEQLNSHLANFGQIVMPGRHELAPEASEINYVGKYFDHHKAVRTNYDERQVGCHHLRCALPGADNYRRVQYNYGCIDKGSSLACQCTNNLRSNYLQKDARILFNSHSSFESMPMIRESLGAPSAAINAEEECRIHVVHYSIPSSLDSLLDLPLNDRDHTCWVHCGSSCIRGKR